jgi:Flp pilus assembly protein TadD
MNVNPTPVIFAMLFIPLAGCSMPKVGEISGGARSNLAEGHGGGAYARERHARGKEYQPANETPLEKARRHFQQGSFALAEKLYRAEVEQDARNAEAWLGLAASYDRLRRFELAMRAYTSLTKLRGYTPTVLNNLGYHYYLQGNMASALKTMERAHAADRLNPYIINNLKTIRAAAQQKRGAWRAKG